MDDLAKRLRKVEPDAPGERTRWYRNPDGPEAADRIDALEAENKALRDGLATAESWLDRWAQHVGNCEGEHYCTCGLAVTRYEARSLLAKGDGR